MYVVCRSLFSLPMVENPGQHVSCKLADDRLLDKYFTYLCKGPHAEELSAAFFLDREMYSGWIVYDMSGSRMVEQLHRQFHQNARDIRSVEAGGSKGQWYEKLAVECRAKGASERDAIMAIVTHYYVYESKKGFDKFAVTRTFWAVFSLVNGVAAHDLILSQCLDLVRS